MKKNKFTKNKTFFISDKKIIRQINIKRFMSKKLQNYLQNQFIFKKITGKKKSINFLGLSIDSKSIKKDNLFLAIKGKNNDGNKFIKEAFKRGARCVVSSDKKKSKKITNVKDTTIFLNNFAKLKENIASLK